MISNGLMMTDENHCLVNGVKYVAKTGTTVCNGCELREHLNCHYPIPACIDIERDDHRNIVWVIDNG
jgi:hypothetical protein